MWEAAVMHSEPFHMSSIEWDNLETWEQSIWLENREKVLEEQKKAAEKAAKTNK